jgi:PIN domain nuclease of toxin-antitoxin system
MSDIFVLDACALVALLKNEKGADNVATVYKKAESHDAQIMLTADHHEFDAIEEIEGLRFQWIR